MYRLIKKATTFEQHKPFFIVKRKLSGWEPFQKSDGRMIQLRANKFLQVEKALEKDHWRVYKKATTIAPEPKSSNLRISIWSCKTDFPKRELRDIDT